MLIVVPAPRLPLEPEAPINETLTAPRPLSVVLPVYVLVPLRVKVVPVALTSVNPWPLSLLRTPLMLAGGIVVCNGAVELLRFTVPPNSIAEPALIVSVAPVPGTSAFATMLVPVRAVLAWIFPAASKSKGAGAQGQTVAENERAVGGLLSVAGIGVRSVDLVYSVARVTENIGGASSGNRPAQNQSPGSDLRESLDADQPPQEPGLQ